MFYMPMSQRILKNLDVYYPLGSSGALDLKSRVRHFNPFDLTNSGVVTRGTGPSNNLRDAANFVAASSQRLDFADADQLSIRGDTTIAGWVYLEDKPAAQRSFFNKWVGTGNQREWHIGHLNTSDRFRVQISPDGTNTGNITVDANTFGAPTVQTWYYVVVQYIEAIRKVRISINAGGFDYSAGTLATQPFVGTGIGGFANNFITGTYFSGKLASWTKWSRLLSQREIEWMYNGGQGRHPLPLV